MNDLQFTLEELQGEYYVSLMGIKISSSSQILAAVPCLGHQELKMLHEQAQSFAGKIREWRSLREEAVAIGSILFLGLMATPEIQASYREALDRVREERSTGRYVILHLILDIRSADLNVLPWELMYDPNESLFLSSCEYISISRLGGPRDYSTSSWKHMMRWRPPLRMLLLLPCPQTAQLQGIPTELPCPDGLAVQKMLDRLACRAGKSTFTFKLLHGEESTPEALRAELARATWDILYFIGHSFPDPIQKETFLLLEDGSPRRLAKRLGVRLLQQWLTASSIRVVILSSCSSLQAGITLMQHGHLSAAIAMPSNIPMIWAPFFNEAVLEALSAWRPLDECIIHGRQRILDVLPDYAGEESFWQYDDRPDWALPSLLLRDKFAVADFSQIPEGNYLLGVDDLELESLRSMWQISSRVGPDWLILSKREIVLKTFFLSRWPVTNYQYLFFLEQTRYEDLPPGFEREGVHVRLLPTCQPDEPVTGITLRDAKTYCRWAGARLPSADEWEAAARGADYRLFPWGNLFSFDKLWLANDKETAGPVSVFLRDSGASPYGVEDLCGNVAEWTCSRDESGEKSYVVGGSWKMPAWKTLPSVRLLRDGMNSYPDVGFRIAR